eukprot:3926615-Pyramimonas_sp.AAC.1
MFFRSPILPAATATSASTSTSIPPNFHVHLRLLQEAEVDVEIRNTEDGFRCSVSGASSVGAPDALDHVGAQASALPADPGCQRHEFHVPRCFWRRCSRGDSHHF